MVQADATGIDPNESKFTLLPKGWHEYEIVHFLTKDGKEFPLEGLSQNGDPTVQLVCLTGDSRVFHNVTFIKAGKPGAGIWVHFLKTLGLPFEGPVNIHKDDWLGKRFMGYTIEDEYKGKRKNKITDVKPLEKKEDNNIPF